MRSFTERMAAGRDLAQDRRNRGLPAGAPAKGWKAARRAPDAAAGSWDDLVARARAGYRAACSEARAEYDWQARLRFIVGETGDALAF